MEQLKDDDHSNSELERRAQEIAQQASDIGRTHALLYFPLVLIPRILIKGATALGRQAYAHGERRLKERKRERPPRPMSLGLSLLAAPFSLALFALWERNLSVRDRTNAVGLLFLTTGTFFVSPELLGLPLLRRLDEWWLESDLPAHQLAFTRHLRRLNRLVLKATLATSLACIIIVTLLVGIAYAGNWSPEVRLTDDLVRPLAYATGTALLAFIGSLGLRVLLGRVDSLPLELFTAADVERSLHDRAVRDARLRAGAGLFAVGTILSFVATVFIR
jgi:hypothetical protein